MNIKEIGNVFHCDCGFSWHRGKNGNHNCADGLREKVRQLAAENVALKSAITDHSHSVHFCEVCGKDDPCSTDDVCYALKDISVVMYQVIRVLVSISFLNPSATAT
ncbi:hypothetical protein [Klebsiella variicola]|uniref:hypothetical protein n=1 Tax=Klebsiella variicola TaxID=244366 RepID=UPI0009CEDD65|nr:hypothetical protein [Klebsiella variicola]SMB42387.1 Uncharacterised protein [Klebsiella variicola]